MDLEKKLTQGRRLSRDGALFIRPVLVRSLRVSPEPIRWWEWFEVSSVHKLLEPKQAQSLQRIKTAKYAFVGNSEVWAGLWIELAVELLRNAILRVRP